MTRQVIALLVVSAAVEIATAEDAWRKHVVYEGVFVATAVGGDFTGDQMANVICNSGGKTGLLVAPDWREIILDEIPSHGATHSETFDIDVDLDYIAARYMPGLVLAGREGF